MLDDSGRVIYVGSFSKTTLPTIRLGFIVAPPSLWSALWGAKYLTDWHSPVPLQAAMAEFIGGGQFARHVRRMRLVYETRHGLVSDILLRRFSSEFHVVPSAAGLHVSATAVSMAPDRIQAIVRQAARMGVQCYPIGLFALTRAAPSGLVIGYGAVPTDRIEAGLERLHRSMVASH
jgi:GntR family transcriptional regulator/MocR family aminotransferase